MSPALGLIVCQVPGLIVSSVLGLSLSQVLSLIMSYFLCFIVSHIGMSFILSCVFDLFVSHVLSVSIS